ncbi:uncharacterized protein [Montipora foliosa]|uniref:uncharacterized protein isoform X2 n=1 Tax=Montipora foliosa TaxID=591990 RepID=UPI0035F1BF5A
MSEDADKTVKMPGISWEKRSRFPLGDTATDELGTVVTQLEDLPFEDETQRTSFLESVYRLENYHIIQIYKLGVVPLWQSMPKSSEFHKEAKELFDLCLSFCYTQDVAERVVFDYFSQTLNLCFPLQPKKCLSTKVVFKLLELVQFLQRENFASIEIEQLKEQEPNTNQVTRKGTNHLVTELMAIFEARRDRAEGCITDLIDQTKQFASVDAQVHKVKDLRKENFVSIKPVFLTSWIKVMKMAEVGNDFASCLAEDLLHFRFGYEPVVQLFRDVLLGIKNVGGEIRLLSDQERIILFLKNIKHFCQHRQVASVSLKFLANPNISIVVVRLAFENFLFKGKQKAFQYPCLLEILLELACPAIIKIIDLLSNVSTLFPNEVLHRILQFCGQSFSINPDYQNLGRLLSLFLDGSSNESYCSLQERTERKLAFLQGLSDSTSIRFTSIWCPFLEWLLKEFPTSFHENRTEVITLIRNTLSISQLPIDEQTRFVTMSDAFFGWVSKQGCTVETKTEIFTLLVQCSSSGSSIRNVEFFIAVIKPLCLCTQFTLEFKKVVLHELGDLAKRFKLDEERRVFQEIFHIPSGSRRFECAQELLTEILNYLKGFVDKDIPHTALNLVSLISRVPISDDRRLKVLHKAKTSSSALSSSIHMLELVECFLYKEVANKFLDILYMGFFETFKEDKDLFKKLQAVYPCASLTTLPIKGILEVAKLISLHMCNEQVYKCCFNVVGGASGMSDSEMVQLFWQVKRSAENIVSGQNEGQSSDGSYLVRHTFTASLCYVVSTRGFSGKEKLLFVEKVCDIFRMCLDNSTGWNIVTALENLIPLHNPQNDAHSTGGQQDQGKMSLKSSDIVVLLGDSTMMAQLAKISPTGNYSLCSVLSKMNPNSFSRDKLVDVYNFIRSQKDLDEGFFRHILAFLEVGIQETNSVEELLGVLQELEHVVRAILPYLIPFAMLSFKYMLQNQVGKPERKQFVDEVIMKWHFSPIAEVVSYLKVLQLLWKTFTAGYCSAKRCEVIHRVEDILKGVNEELNNYCTKAAFFGLREECKFRKISCHEFDWLVFHSTLSNSEAALALGLSFRSRSTGASRIRCFTQSGERIVDGHLKIVKDKMATLQEVSIEDSILAQHTAAVGSVGYHSTTTNKISSCTLTPAFIAQEMIQILRRILVAGEDITEISFLLWNNLFDSRTAITCIDYQCIERLSYFLDDYVGILLSILGESLSKEVFLFWVNQNWHHVYQCSDIILKACKRTATKHMDERARLEFHTAIYNSLEMVRTRTPDPARLGLFGRRNSCFRILEPQLKNFSEVLDSTIRIEVTQEVFDLFQINAQAGAACAEMVSSWSSQKQAIKLVEGVKRILQENEEHPEVPALLELSRAFGRFCMDSCNDLLHKLSEQIERYRDDPKDVCGLIRLPQWRQMMIGDGFSSHVIDCWCVAFLTTPREDLSSRDVDAIVDLNPHSLQLVSSVSQTIKNCIFPDDGFSDKVRKGVKEFQTSERLRLARLLGELINVLKQRKPEENREDAVIREIIVEACDELCKEHLDINRKQKRLYKIRDKMLKSLFNEVFGKQGDQDIGSDLAGNTGVDHENQPCEEKGRRISSLERQRSYLHENLPRLVKDDYVYKSLSVLLRRWLSSISVKPVLASHTRKVIQLMFLAFSSEKKETLPTPEELHCIVRGYILSLERNQALISQLQAGGYNQKGQSLLDLWSSPSVECPGYLSDRECANRQRLEKIHTKNLRCLWNEWKDILTMDMVGVMSVKVGEETKSTKDLFSLQASFEIMDEEASAIRPIVRQVGLQIPALGRRVDELIRVEQRHRARIKTLRSSNEQSTEEDDKKGAEGADKTEISGAGARYKSEKFVAVWDNRFLENVKLCSERIPGCYAPNGFHSEKPVLCALSVDNRILTVFKEKKNGQREEFENVEVKLFDAGMFVYGLHTSGHDYVTDELWAAFFKKLLEEGLVPRMVLTDESPGFDWIKQFVKPERTLPFPSKWELHQGLAPLQEDYFDYYPVMMNLQPSPSGFVILSRENVSSIQFKNFKHTHIVEEEEKRTNQLARMAIEELAENGKKLGRTVRRTINRMVDGEQITKENIENDLGSTLKQHGQAVLLACENAIARSY